MAPRGKNIKKARWEEKEIATATLSDDVLEEIFTRLPAKSVLRCRCLSRFWAAALSSDDFADRHLHRHRGAVVPRKLLFFSQNSRARDSNTTVHGCSLHSPDDDDGAPPLMAGLPRGLRNSGVGQCNGLFILKNDITWMYYVWNPSTGQMTALPRGRSTMGRPWPSEHHSADNCWESLGLGYDARSKKHKVVRVCHRAAVCEVYELDSPTGYWRPPATAMALQPCRAHYPSVFAQGQLHWKARKPHEHALIVSFCLADEGFGVLSPPPGAGRFLLTEIDGRLCLSTSAAEVRRQDRYDIWLLRDHEAGGAWDLRCRIDVSVKCLRPLPREKGFVEGGVMPLDFTDGGRRVLLRPGLHSDPRRLCAYTPATGEMEELSLAGASVTHYGESVTQAMLLLPYEETVVSPGTPYERLVFSSASAQALRIALRRPPAVDLRRLKLVCRSWLAMVESDRFLKLHHEVGHAGTGLDMECYMRRLEEAEIFELCP
jgi:F-box interacting protein